MWLGPGGVIAFFLGVWGWIWAARRIRGRPRGDWLATALSIGVLQAALVLLTSETWLAITYAEVAASPLPIRGERMGAVWSAYGPLLWGLVGMALFGVGLFRARSAWTVGGSVGRITRAYAAAQGGLLGVSVLVLLAFHLVYVQAGLDAVNARGATVAANLLLVGIGAAWLAVVSALGCLGWRATLAFRRRFT